MELALIALQLFLFAFLLLHDWVPVRPFNDVVAVRQQNSFSRLILATFVNTIPIAVTLALSIYFRNLPHPPWQKIAVVGILGALFIGEIQAWWIPYFFGASPEWDRRYAAMFGKTHTFLPRRKGPTPNTEHVILHGATVLALLLSVALAILK